VAVGRFLTREGSLQVFQRFKMVTRNKRVGKQTFGRRVFLVGAGTLDGCVPALLGFSTCAHAYPKAAVGWIHLPLAYPYW